MSGQHSPEKWAETDICADRASHVAIPETTGWSKVIRRPPGAVREGPWESVAEHRH